MNFLFAIKLSSDFLQGSNIYKLWEKYAKFTFLSTALIRSGTTLHVLIQGYN